MTSRNLATRFSKKINFAFVETNWSGRCECQSIVIIRTAAFKGSVINHGLSHLRQRGSASVDGGEGHIDFN